MRRAMFAIFGTIAGLTGLLSFKTTSTTANTSTAVTATAPGASAAAGTSPAAATPTSVGTVTSPSSTTSSGSSSAAPTSSASSSSATKTVTGTAIDTRYGPVQVRITVTNGKVSSATAVEYPSGDPRDQQINASAIPTLTKETVAAGNAKIDMVSGATYTSEGYVSSLQSALNKAGL